MKRILLLFLVSIVTCAAWAQAPKVGLGTRTPRGTWDVNGNLYTKNKFYIDSMPVATGSVGSLGVLSTGEIVKIATVNNAATISLITYNLNNVAGTRIGDYDTKIDTSRYIVAIVGLVFSKYVRLPTVNGAMVEPPIIANVFATATNTWHLNMDYSGATTDDGGNGNWKIQLLVISKNIASAFPLISVPFNGGTTGSAPPPAGM